MRGATLVSPASMEVAQFMRQADLPQFGMLRLAAAEIGDPDAGLMTQCFGPHSRRRCGSRICRSGKPVPVIAAMDANSGLIAAYASIMLNAPKSAPMTPA